mmetsp:Transcript_49407/g.55916  ORF Transcript_49407/g.55916 Transcript_49407/m.55916 type:complete len:84 (+) Transcript_49407:36-287(+)
MRSQHLIAAPFGNNSWIKYVVYIALEKKGVTAYFWSTKSWKKIVTAKLMGMPCNMKIKLKRKGTVCPYRNVITKATIEMTAMP